MSRIIRSGILGLALAFTLLFVPGLAAQQAKDPVQAAPVPPQIAAAKKVFISNGGVESDSPQGSSKLGDRDRPYNQFYTAMKAWGHYELVSNPADAELVFELRFVSPLWGSGEGISSFAPQLRLTILDARTHFILWTLTEDVRDADRPKNLVTNFNQGMANLVNQVARIAGQPPAIPPEPKKRDDSEGSGPP